MEKIELADPYPTKVDPTAGVTYAWKNLDVFAPSKGLFRKKPKTHILKKGKLALLHIIIWQNFIYIFFLL